MAKYPALSLLFFLSIAYSSLSDQQAYPLLPSKFTQVFSFFNSQTGKNITGKMWFDSIGGQKYEYINSGESCFYYPSSQDCTHVITRGTGYIIIPSKSLCCITSSQWILHRDELKTLLYKGQDSLYGISYDYWTTNASAPLKMYYWSNISSSPNPAPIPRRFIYSIGNLSQQRDYWVNTYSQSFDSASTFYVPPYCTRKCPNSTQINPNKDNKVNNFIYSNFGKRTPNLKVN